MLNNKSRSFTIFFILLLTILTFSFKTYAQDTPDTTLFHLTILYDNDIHGRLIPFDDSRAGKNIGGAARRSYLISKIKNENPNTLALSGGDWISGTPISGFYKGKIDFETYELMPYDALVIGNHEFDFGQENLREFIKTSQRPVLSANIFEQDSDKLLAQPYLIKELNGIKVAILGLTTPDTPTTTHPKNVVGLKFGDPVEISKKYMGELKEKADIVIALNHLGLGEDKELASKVNGFDVIVGGHSHTKVDGFIKQNDTIIVQDYQWGIYLGKLDLTIENKKIRSAKAELLPVTSDIPEDEKLAAYLKPYSDEILVKMKEPVGKTEVDLEKPSFGKPESNLANWIADVFREKVNADIAFQNTGGIRANIPKGIISYDNLYSVLPFENLLVVLEVNGKQLKNIMDDLAKKIDEGHETSSVSGVTFTVKNKMAENILIHGQPIQEDKNYTLAVNDFMASGGSGYSLLKEAKLLRYDDLLRDIVIDYCKKHPSISPGFETRIQIVNP